MNPDSIANLNHLWTGMIIHLWQTTLVVVPLFLLARWMKHAPARVQDGLWLLGLLKLLVPLSLLGWTLNQMIWTSASWFGFERLGALPGWFASVTGILDPGVISTLSPGTAGPQPPTVLCVLLVLATVIWVAGAVFVVGKTTVDAVRSTIELRRSGAHLSELRVSPNLDRPWVSKLRRVLDDTRIEPSLLRITREGTMPGVVGFFRPVILVPVTAIEALEPEELRAILEHEHAHCRRRDPLRTVLVRLAIALFFFYPLVWPLVRRLRATTEMSCDEEALQAGVDGDELVAALAHTVRLGLSPLASSSGLSVHRSPILKARFAHLADPGRHRVMKVHRIALATAALFVAALSTTVLVGGLTDSIAGENGKTEASDTEAVVAPRPINVEGPVYPTDARENGIEGRVLLRVEVLETGRVGTVEAIEEVEGYPSMTKSAIDAVEGWTFEPSSKGGKAITLTVMIPIQYRLDPEAENPKSK